MTQEPLMDEIKEVILEALTEKPVLNSAARAAGIKPIELHKALEEDEHFAREVEVAQQIGKGEAENALWERGVVGLRSPVIHGGKIVMIIDEESGESRPLMEAKFSDKLLELYLKSQMSDVYGERSKIEVEGTAVLIAPKTPDLEGFRDMLSAHRQKERDGGDEEDQN